jgi:hypothetical protein
MKRISILLAICLALFIDAAHAQNPVLNQARTYGIFTPTGRAPNLAATTVSARVTLGVAGPVAWVCNTGSDDVFVRFGTSTVLATTNADTLIRGGMCVQLDATGATHLASITASGSTTLVTSIGNGSINAVGGNAGSSGGGGGSVTQGTVPWIVGGNITTVPVPNTAAAVVTLRPDPGAVTVAGCSVQVASNLCLAAASAVRWLQVQNTHATSTVACAWGGTAVLNDTGSFMLAPGQSASWGPNTAGVPNQALNCIASVAATPLYVEYR